MCNGTWQESETTCEKGAQRPQGTPTCPVPLLGLYLKHQAQEIQAPGTLLHLSLSSHTVENPDLLLWPTPALEILCHSKPSQPKVPAVLQLSHQHNSPRSPKLISQQTLAFSRLSAQVLVNKQGVCWQGLNTSQRHLHFNKRLLQEFRPQGMKLQWCIARSQCGYFRAESPLFLTPCS